MRSCFLDFLENTLPVCSAERTRSSFAFIWGLMLMHQTPKSEADLNGQRMGHFEDEMTRD